MNSAQILCTLKDVPSFLGVYPSDILPHSITRSVTLTVNKDPHTAKGTHWLAIHLQPRSYSGYFFDSYGLSPLIPSILTFLRRVSPSGNTTRPSCKDGPVQSAANTAVYSHSTWTAGTTPQQFVGLFDAATADRQISRLFASEFGSLRTTRRGGQGCTASIKGTILHLPAHLGLDTRLTRSMEAVVDFEQLSGTQNETVLKELSIAGRNVLKTFQFQNPYAMRPHGESKRSIMGRFTYPYNQLFSVLNDAFAGFAHSYAYGDYKCTLISQLLARPVHLEDFKSPSPRYFRPKFSFTEPCHRNSSFRCATRHAHSLYEWLMYHFRKISCYLP